MYWKSAACCLVLALFLAGCGSDKTAPPPSKSDVAAQTKAQVDEFVQKAKQNPQTAASDLELLIESLDARAADSGGAYGGLRDAAKELLAMYQRSAGQAEISGQLDKLSQAAAGL
jgi:outer membrane PBP1 activator LpoA protein